MRPLELRLAGNYYDSQVYSGILYLWTTKNSLLLINWSSLIAERSQFEPSRLAIECAFTRNDMLYNRDNQRFLIDPNIKRVLTEQFDSLVANPIEIGYGDLRRFVLGEMENPFRFPHADTAIYSNQIFVGSKLGIWQSQLGTDAVWQPADRFTDVPAIGLAAGSSRLAVAAGGDGAFQTYLLPEAEDDFTLITKASANTVRWLGSSLFVSARSGPGEVADFESKPNEDEESRIHLKRSVRDLTSTRSLVKRPVSDDRSFAWGGGDRLCVAENGLIDVVRFAHRRKSLGRFHEAGTIQEIDGRNQRIISADNAVFGFVIEYENGLHVLDSSGASFWIQGSIGSWRVFPRSKYYTSQLHVIHDEYLSVLSFNNDYFVDQKLKLAGTRHIDELRNRYMHGSQFEPTVNWKVVADEELDNI